MSSSFRDIRLVALLIGSPTFSRHCFRDLSHLLVKFMHWKILARTLFSRLYALANIGLIKSDGTRIRNWYNVKFYKQCKEYDYGLHHYECQVKCMEPFVHVTIRGKENTYVVCRRCLLAV